MKAKIFEVSLHRLPAGQSLAGTLEELMNSFLVQNPDIRVVATHINTIVTPPEPNAMSKSEESSVLIFCTMFYTR